MSGKRPKVLDGLSELMVFSNYPEAKNIMIFGFDFEGDIDVDAMNLALSYTLPSFPEFMSFVKESGTGMEKRLNWFLDTDFKPEFRQTRMTNLDNSLGFEHSLINSLDQSVNKDWDLLRTVPTEFHVVSLPDGRRSLLALVHHAAADGWTLASFYRDLMAHYHRIVTGNEPEWARDYDFVSSVKTRMVEMKNTRLNNTLYFLKNMLDSYVNKPCLPLGRGESNKTGVHYSKLVLTSEETKHVTRNVSQRSSPFIDGLIAGMARSIDQWNASYDQKMSGDIIICVTVQMRGRFGEVNTASNSSSLKIRLGASERRDPDVLYKTVSSRRQMEQESLSDVRVCMASNSLADSIRILPLKIRQKIGHYVCQMRLIPTLIAPFGLMWPEFRNGRRTGDSYLKEVGKLNLMEFHAFPYELGYNCPLILGAYTFRKRLNLQIMASSCLLTAEETVRFTRLLKDMILESLSAAWQRA